MNLGLFCKLIFILAVLFFMVLMGMSNKQPTLFNLGIGDVRYDSVPAAIMYFIFFGIGVLTGAVLAVGAFTGGGKKSSSSSPSKGK